MTDVRVTVEPAKRLKLPPAGELAEHVRDSTPRQGNSPPPAFVEAQLRMAAVQTALEIERGALHKLIREAYRRGVPLNTLARWSGYTSNWVGAIVRGAYE